MQQLATTAAERLMSTAEVADWTGVSPNTLRFWRWEGSGPAWFRLGAKTVKYKSADVQAWLDSEYAKNNPGNAGAA
jgi:predicted DNA-binding transcriptional regulator AlpA